MKTIGKSCLAVSAWVALCMCAVSAAGKPAAKLIWPSSDVSLEAQQGATIEERGGTVFVQTGRCRPNSFPNVRFVYRETADLSGTRAIRATLTNCTDIPLRILLKVKGETAQGWLPEGGCMVPAHSGRVYTLPLVMERWVFDKDPNLVGLKRRPHVGGAASCSLSRVKAISAFIVATDNVRYGVSDLELVEDGSPETPPTELKADSFCPWVDEFGQANFAEWPDKIHSRDELRARGAVEESEIAANPDGIPDADRFGGWAKGPQLKATGRFRTEKVNGKWWFVDPDGHLFFSHGVNCAWEQAATGVTGRENYFEKLPPREGDTRQFWTYFTTPALRNYYDDPAHVPFWAFSFTSYDLWLKYGEGWRIKNAEMSYRRMKSWGINTYTAGSIPGFDKLPRRIPFVAGFNTKSRPIVGVEGYWGKLNDPFAPEFEKNCIESAKRTGAWGTNEWCIGWTVDNERSWGYDGALLARGVLNSPEDQPARVALMKILAEKGMTTNTVTREVLCQMGEAVAEKYYLTVRAAIKGISPDILYLGDRNNNLNPDVFRAAARNCDVVTVNVYDYIPSVELPPDAEDKPLLVTEFHFGCYDTGYFYATIFPVKDQKARAESYLEYLRSAVDNPAYVGAHWFCWRDCPITGHAGRRGEGSNAQCGLVSMADVPYSELVKAIRTVSREMYQRRAPVAIAGAAAPRLDFSVPGSLRVVRGAFQDGATGQISYGADGATVRLDAARVKASEPSYYALAPVPACKADWRDRRVSLYVKLGDPSPVRRSLSLEFRDADGETFRYKPVSVLCLGDMTRLDYVVTEKGVSLKTWGKKTNGRFDGTVRLGALLGSYVPEVGAGEVVYVKLVSAEANLARTIDAYIPISEDKTFPGPKPLPKFEEVIATPSGRVGRLKTTAVEALDFDVDTGDPLHLIRGGRGVPTLVFGNLSRGTRRWKGTVRFRDHFGRGFEQTVDVTAAPEARVRVALDRALPFQGMWYVTAELTGDDGQTGVAEARFAAVDRHEATPILPKPYFRMGINFHAQHYWNTPHFERVMDALVASGAKLVRSGGFKFADVAKARTNDWTMTDALVKAYRSHGIAINANVYPAPAWALAEPAKNRKGVRHRMNLPPREGLFREFCAAIAARYGTEIDYYEMGNEWDLTSNEILPPDEALRLIREGYAGVKASCPNATVIPCGWACADSSVREKLPNPGLIEKFAGTAQDAFDVWALHLHGPFESYAERLQKQFFPMRKRLGLDAKPWYSNETALNTAGDEEAAARAVWQKILYAWAWGSTDYIWYNLRATGWNPSAGEDSYGLITPDYRPRATYAAFAALATLIEGGRFDARLVDAGLRHVYRFHTPGGKGLTIAGWDAGCWKGEAMRIRSDAKAAWAVDLMGNRTELKSADGVWTWTISREPSAIVLDGATSATVEAAVSACGPAVVLPDSPTAVEKSAAKELADGLEKCLGKRPEVVSEGAMREGRAPARPCLFVGATKASAAVRSRGSATLPAWETDGVLLKSVKDGVVLDGDPARAPIYAVDLYLEKYCGVRWWTSDAATYPKLAAAGDSRPPVPIEGIDLSYAPQFKYRETYYLDGFDPLFKVRSKGNFTSLTRYMLTDMEFIPPELGGNHSLYFFEGRHSAYHSFFEILPPKTYFGAHPEWYSLVDGKRQPKQLCLANAEMKAEYISETLKRLREDSSVDFIQVSQNDWHGYCQCEKCKAMMDEDGGAPSGPYLRFANDVAEAVEKEFPKVRIDTFAYQFTRQAPTKTRPRHNVVVRLCDIECDFARPLSDPSSPLNAAFAKDIADWKRVAGGNLYIWDYLANFWSYMLPHPNISQIAPNIRLFAENGAVGIFEQGDALCSAGSFATLRHYMAAHLLWDPSDDENRLMDEFLSGYYGKSAANALRKFIEVVDNGPRKTKMTVGCGHRRVPFLTASDKLLAARLMDEAVAAAEKDGEPFAARVRRERLSVDHYLLFDYDVLRKFAAKKDIPWTRPETRAEAATNWMREVRAFGVKASRETTSAGEIEAYLAKICDDEAFSNYMKAAKPDKIRKQPSPAARQ